MLQGRRGREEEKKRKAKEEKKRVKEKRVAQEKKKKKNEKAGFTEIQSSKRKALKMQAEAKQKEEEAK